jgi:hypothetical protein
MSRSIRIFMICCCLVVSELTACQSPHPERSPTTLPEVMTPSPAGTTGMDLNFIQPTPTVPDRLSMPSTIPPSVPATLRQLVPSGSRTLPDQEVAALAIDETSVYWVPAADLRHIYRALLSSPVSSKPETVVQSRYITGTLAAMPIQVHGDHLVFLDEAFNANNPVWQLRAYNLVTHQDKSLIQAGGNYLAHIYSFSADSAQVAWIMQDFLPKRPCPEESILTVTNLNSGKVSELDRSCATKDSQWNTVGLSGKRVIASATALKDGNPSTIYLWNDLAAKPQALSSASTTDQPSFPTLGPNWCAWQAGLNNTRIDHLADGETLVLTSPLNGSQLAGPAIDRDWLTWLPTPDVLVYQLNTAAWTVAVEPLPGEQITQVAIGGGWIAWSRQTSAGSSKNSQIEWAKLN